MTDRPDLVWGIRPKAGIEPSLAHRYFGVLEFLSIDPGGFGADIFYTEDRGPVGDFYLHLVTGLVTLLLGVLLGSRRSAPQPVSQR